jgi:hypothetical protein
MQTPLRQPSARLGNGIAIGAAKKLLPKDVEQGASALVKRMTDNPTFKRFALPNFAGGKSEDSYLRFIKNPVVQAIKTSLEKLGTKDQKLRLNLTSLLTMYPQDWVTRHIGRLGRTTTRNAKDHAQAVGPGLRTEFETPVERNRRFGPKDEFLSQWLDRRENVEYSPEIKRLRSGELVKESIKYRILNAHKGYEKYKKDAQKEGYPVYSQSHFYIREDELGLVDPKSDAGLCPNCHRYGKETWDDVKQCIELLYMPTNPKRQSALDQANRFHEYFRRSGPFYSSLSRKNDCLDWCCQYALSDPFDENFQSLCDDHAHSCRDELVVECDSFFHDLIEASLAFVGEKTIKATFTIDGTQRTGRVDYLRFDKVRIKREESDEVVGVDIDIDWDKAGLHNSDVNLLVLSDRLRDCYYNHLRLRKHLYLDRNQTIGESVLRRHSTCLVFLDYMMKLRAKMFQSDTSKFHLLMNKGSSVHVFAVKERLTEETLADLRSFDRFSDAQVRDYMMVWIDSFGSNTTQGGFETLCAQEAALRQLKALRAHIQEVDFCSDAGSGYKSTQTILGLRDAKRTTRGTNRSRFLKRDNPELERCQQRNMQC